MKTRIICLKRYARTFKEGLSEAEFDIVWKNIVEVGKKFHESYKSCISQILESIPRDTGFEWIEFSPEKVPIYLVDSNGPSISNPLTLKVRDNIEYMLTVLTHELIHVNMPGILFEDKVQYEDIVNQVTLDICKQIGISSGFETIEAYQNAMQKKGFVSKKLNLEEKTVREALGPSYKHHSTNQ